MTSAKVVPNGLRTRAEIDGRESLAPAEAPSEKKPTTPSFIRLSGTPPIDLKVCIPQIRKSGVHLPEQVTLHVEGESLIDAQTEDIFTLETFQNLVVHCHRQGKNFLLARVMTIDTSFEGSTAKCYWSDYAAHHINKVLYRTQLEQNLLHRMRCRNPLNNMPIVGRVYYYAVSSESVAKSHRDYEHSSGLQLVLDTRPLPWAGDSSSAQGNVSQVSMALSDGTQEMRELNSNLKMQHRKSFSETALDLGAHKPVETSERDLISKLEKTSNQLQPNKPSSGRPSSPVPANDKLIITYEASFIGTDENFMMRSEFRDVFSRHAVNAEDAHLFPLFGEGTNFAAPNVASPAAAANASTSQASAAAGGRRVRQAKSWKNLGGLLYVPAINSLCFRGTGFIEPWFFLLLTVAYVAGVVCLCVFLMEDIFAYVVGFALAVLWVFMALAFVAWPY